MNDSNFIEEIARKWVELGGDSEGVAWGWKRLQEAVINIEYAQQSVQSDGAKCACPEPQISTLVNPGFCIICKLPRR